MKILVFSDSHGDFAVLDRIVSANPEVDCFIFLGDGMRDLYSLRARHPGKRILCVAGNCDVECDEKSEDTLIAHGKKIYFTHGHIFEAEHGYGDLLNRAASLDADIVCFGHTHCSLSEIVGGIHILNPGSVSRPRDKKGASYAVIDITQDEILTKITKL